MSKLRRWLVYLLVAFAVIPLASCGIMQTQQVQNHDLILELALSKAAFQDDSTSKAVDSQADAAIEAQAQLQPPAPVPTETPPEVLAAKPDQDESLITELSNHFRQPREIVSRIVAAANRMARADFPSRNDILAIIAVESSFNPRASHSGSKGLMQIQLSSHRDKLRGKNPYDVDDNVTIGAAILEEYYTQLDKNRRAAVLAYNAGIGSYLRKRYVERYHAMFQKALSFMDSITK